MFDLSTFCPRHLFQTMWKHAEQTRVLSTEFRISVQMAPGPNEWAQGINERAQMGPGPGPNVWAQTKSEWAQSILILNGSNLNKYQMGPI